MTLNIWNRSGPWEGRRERIRTVLRELAPDLVGLQEVLRTTEGDKLDQLAEVSDGLGYHTVYGRHADERGHPLGNAILSKWPIARTEVMTLSSGGFEEYRCLVFAEIAAPFANVPFFTTHLNWKLHHGHVRALQIREVASHVKRLAPLAGFPPILVGDFNSEPDSDEMRFMRGLTALGGESVYFADCFHLVGTGSPGTFCKRNPFAAIAREPDRRIDYIYVRGPDDRGRGDPIDARVCADAPIDGIFPTDHFGVIATISTAG
jgi:endonuclease/exonuclease/phosphatase family metal-dependent hydrolase